MQHEGWFSSVGRQLCEDGVSDLCVPNKTRKSQALENHLKIGKGAECCGCGDSEEEIQFNFVC